MSVNYFKISLLGLGGLLGVQSAFASKNNQSPKRPNVVYVFVDQLRAQALGYAGDKNVQSPNLDRLSKKSINFSHAISCIPVSTPHRGCLLTGQYPLTNGMFLNDIQLNPDAVSFGKIFRDAGYETGYVGKWHVNGHGREKYIPKEYRQGFDYFKVLECSHNYMHSPYYDNDNPEKKYWEGYDALAQSKDAAQYIKRMANKDAPFLLFLSLGSPHNPYNQVPDEYKKIYADKDIELRPNVPAEKREKAVTDIKGYYAHISAIDDCVAIVENAIKEAGIEDNTIFVFTSDHGDMLYSQGMERKQKPWDESIRVPFLLKYPALFKKGKKTNLLLNTPDILPTMLGLTGINIPKEIEGQDLSPILRGEKKDFVEAALIESISVFGGKVEGVGVEYRGIRTHRYTYVKNLKGAWLLYDNKKDPYQLKNLVNEPKHAKIQSKLEGILMKMLKERGDEFLPGDVYVKKWNYKVDQSGTVPYWQYR